MIQQMLEAPVYHYTPPHSTFLSKSRAVGELLRLSLDHCNKELK